MKKFLIILLICYIPFSSIAQDKNNPLIFCYGKNKVYQNELERGYLRNKDLVNDKPTSKDVDDYLTLYQNFKLKVQDAYDRQMDTMPAYKKELAQYRAQLAKKYLNDSSVTEELVREGYERSKEIINASHILILAGFGSSAEDTLKAYNKIDKIRNDIIANKVSFDQAAIQYSEDPSSKNKGALGYKGNLGWFSTFQFLYTFEDMAYETATDSISPVFRTRYGYHILKVNGRKKSKGERKIAAIKIYRRPTGTPDDTMNIYNRVQAVYKLLSEGEGWDTTLTKYTEDPNARYNRGVYNWFSETTNKLPSNVVKEAFSLSVKEQISKPILAKDAYYIIKLVDMRAIPSFEKKEYEIRNKVTQDGRIYKSTVATVARIKKENNFTENTEALSQFAAAAGPAFKTGTWNSSNTQNGTKELFTIGEQIFTVDSFSKFIATAQRPGQQIKSGSAVIKSLYGNFVNQMVLNYEDDNLEKNYPEFAYVYQDFKDGILFFNINSLEVWNKPMTDTAGMRAYYNANIDSFVWEDRVKMLTINASSNEILDQAYELLKQGWSKDSVMNKLNQNNALNIYIDLGLYEKGMNNEADSLILKKDEWSKSNPIMVKKGLTNGVYRAYVGTEIIPSSTKPYENARGDLSAMYQKKVENVWLDELRKKYKIKVSKKNYKAFKNKMLSL
jgi:peptidyl-prolyl cis-trans isomerase SurA